jgi:ribosomal protein S18 acetylase RimI-like enzyme
MNDHETPTIVCATADGLSIAQFADVFTLGYSGYFVPVSLNAERMQQHITNHDIDLRASWAVFVDAVPVALCLLGLRGGRGWIGGGGVAPDYRRRGLAQALVGRGHASAQERGVSEIMLEMLVQNVQAKTLYEQLGYREIMAQWEMWLL